jgi:hypothetical protein
LKEAVMSDKFETVLYVEQLAKKLRLPINKLKEAIAPLAEQRWSIQIRNWANLTTVLESSDLVRMSGEFPAFNEVIEKVWTNGKLLNPSSISLTTDIGMKKLLPFCCINYYFEKVASDTNTIHISNMDLRGRCREGCRQ